MRIICNEDNDKIQLSTQLANDVLQNSVFYDRISSRDSFDLSTATPKQISNLLKDSDLNFNIELFRPTGFYNKVKYRKTLAFTDHDFPNTLFINEKKLNRSSESIAATIIHESIHALDHNEVDFTFGHGNNSSKGKGNTAPYWIGNLAYKLFKNDFGAEDLVFDQLEEEI